MLLDPGFSLLRGFSCSGQGLVTLGQLWPPSKLYLVGAFLLKWLSLGPGPLHILHLNRHGKGAHVVQMCSEIRGAPLEGRAQRSERGRGGMRQGA